MAGIEFDRQIFTPAAEAQRAQAPKAMGVILLVLASDSRDSLDTKFHASLAK